MEVHYIKGHGEEYLERQFLALALVAAIVGAALVSLHEQERNLLGIKMIILYHFSVLHHNCPSLYFY